MPTFYKGAGLGTHWHKNDSRRGVHSAVTGSNADDGGNRNARRCLNKGQPVYFVNVYRQDLLSLEEG